MADERCGDGEGTHYACECVLRKLDATARQDEAARAALRRLSNFVTAHHRCPATGPCDWCDEVAVADDTLLAGATR